MPSLGSTTDLPLQCSPEHYFVLDDASEVKLDYRGGSADGEVVAREAATEWHSLITANVGAVLRSALRGSGSRFYPSDFRVGVAGPTAYTYTDGHVICGPTRLDPRDPGGRTALNPRMIVEVLSPSTSDYDRGSKFKRYMQAESFQEYVLVEQNEPRVDVIYRQGDGTWLITPHVGLDAVARLRSVEVDLPLAEVYLNVTFPAAGPT